MILDQCTFSIIHIYIYMCVCVCMGEMSEARPHLMLDGGAKYTSPITDRAATRRWQKISQGQERYDSRNSMCTIDEGDDI